MPGGFIMKTTIKILTIATLLLASGSGFNYAFSQEVDDVYFTPKKNAKQTTGTERVSTTESPVGNESLQPKTENVAAPQETDGMTDYERYSLEKEKEFLGKGTVNTTLAKEAVRDTLYSEDMQEESVPVYSTYEDTDDGGTVINNYYLDNNDYDYFYTSRIRRFHSPYYGYNYYDPWYSDMYFYNYDPFYWGTSIYLGYNWGGFGYNYYYPSFYSNHYYYDYYSPYGYGYGYSPYYSSSYYSGYYHGYYHGYNNGYYGDYSRTNYYGHRSTRSSSSPYGSARYEVIHQVLEPGDFFEGMFER